MSLEATRPSRIDLRLEPGELSETISVAADEPEDVGRKSLGDASAQSAPSQNVFNLQRRVVGVLPVRIDVPRAGAAYGSSGRWSFDENDDGQLRLSAR